MPGYRPAQARSLPLLPLCLAVCSAAPAAAQDALIPARTPEVVVTATRIATPAEQVASSLTAITAADIERRQQRTLADALREVPGTYLAQSGGLGTSARLFTRGTESRHTLVLIDGIEINDPSSPDGAFEFQHLLTTEIDRIEVLRGSQSTLYGSDAIGGVVNIITRRGKGPAKVDGLVEGGSFDTFNQRAAISGSQGRFDYALSLGHVQSQGIDITPLRLRPPGSAEEADGYDNTTFSTRLGARLTETFEVLATARYGRTETELDVNPNDPDSRERTYQLFSRLEGRLSALDGRLEQRFGVSYTQYRRRDTNRADPFNPGFSDAANDGQRTKLDWQGDLTLTEGQVLTLGLETEQEEADVSSNFVNPFGTTVSDVQAEVRTNSVFTQLQSSFGDRFFTTIGIRHDDNERFGGSTTYRIAPAYLIRETGTKLKASYGTGFRAPTLFQLFGRTQFGFGTFSGNPALQPEESSGFDLGFEQSLAGNRLRFGATYFDIDIDDLIVFSDDFSTLVNRSSAELRGVESFVAFTPGDRLGFRFDHTFTRAEDATTGATLRRRPKHKASASADWQVLDNARLSFGVLFVGSRVDANAITFADKQLGSYTVLNLAGSYQLAERWTLFGRIENLLDRDFEDPDGFQRPGIAGIVGLSCVWHCWAVF